MHHYAIDERHELCATLRAAGPDAPTLCGGWNTAMLTAHLVRRERSLVEAAGHLPVRRLHDLAETRLAALVKRESYDHLVDVFEDGPPLLSPWALPPLREAVNLLEYVVHHEDVRRAGPEFAPRAIPAARQHAVWARLRVGAPMTMRAVPLGVRLVWPAQGEIRTGRRARRADGPLVTVSGDPVELALVAFGRQRVAQVSYDGAPEDVASVSGARIAV